MIDLIHPQISQIRYSGLVGRRFQSVKSVKSVDGFAGADAA